MKQKLYIADGVDNKTDRQFINDENGATAVEYAIVAGFIAGVIVLAVTQLGIAVSKLFEFKWW